MAREQKGSQGYEGGVCKKICSAMSLRPLGATIRRVSHHYHPNRDGVRMTDSGANHSSFSKQVEPPSEPVSAHKNMNSGGKEILVVNERDDGQKTGKSASRVGRKPFVQFSEEKTTAKFPKADGGGGNKKIEGNDRFSDYIRKMKNKLGVAASNVGRTTERSVTRRDSFNDKVSNYIKRAKIKIRTTTTVGGNHKGAGTKSFKGT